MKRCLVWGCAALQGKCIVESEYLRSALGVTQLALQTKQAPTGELASLVLLLKLAELDMRWDQLEAPTGLPTPAEIRALI